MKYLSTMTEKDLIKWYENTILQQAKKDFKTLPKEHHKQGLENNDCWNLYCYGNVYKAVYIKRGNRTKIVNNIVSKSIKKEKTAVNENENKERFKQSIARAKSRVFELAMCNEFNHFCTFTQDKKLRDRFDITEFRKDFAQFVRNLNRDRENKIKYLLIPEQHKNGAWHMHGLLSGLSKKDLREFTLKEKLPTKMRKKIKNGEKIYDWTKYRRKFGFFTCTAIKDDIACAKYITKYISKDFNKGTREKGQHLFFASQGLKSREVIVKNEFGSCPFGEWDFENEYVKIKEF